MPTYKKGIDRPVRRNTRSNKFAHYAGRSAIITIKQTTLRHIIQSINSALKDHMVLANEGIAV